MEIQEALAIIRKLVGGIHPETGETLQTDCLYRHPQAVRAMQRRGQRTRVPARARTPQAVLAQ
jgi:hypothetical protein